MGWIGNALGAVGSALLPGIGTGIGTAAGGAIEDTFFRNKKKSTDPRFVYGRYIDPTLAAVANPLSSYLASRIGQSVGTYPGETPTIDQNTTNRYNEFMNMNANDLFTKLVEEPQTAAFKRDFDANITEGYAGGLRGSGRYRGSEDAINKFETDLSGLRYTANLAVPEQQMNMMSQYYITKQAQADFAYKAWFDSLPENNPALKSALAFLTGSSGTTGAVATVPGIYRNQPDKAVHGADQLISMIQGGNMSKILTSIINLFGGK